MMSQTSAQQLTAQAIAAAGHPQVPATGQVVVASPAQVQVLAQQQAQSPAGAAASLIIVVVLGFILVQGIREKRVRPMWVALAFAAGVLLSGSIFGELVESTSDSIGTAMMNMLTTVAGPSGQ